MQKNVKFAERLLTRRKALNWSQERLAQESGVSARSIADYERGKTPKGPTLEQLTSLARAMKVPIGYLAGEEVSGLLPAGRESGPIAEAYGMMDAKLLLQQLTNLAQQLESSAPQMRRQYLTHMRELLRALELRWGTEERGPKGSDPAPSASSASKKGAQVAIESEEIARKEREKSEEKRGQGGSPGPTRSGHERSGAADRR